MQLALWAIQLLQLLTVFGIEKSGRSPYREVDSIPAMFRTFRLNSYLIRLSSLKIINF